MTPFFIEFTTHVLNECHFSVLLLEGISFKLEDCVMFMINSVVARVFSEYLVWIISLMAV